ncbi:MAG: hypothetical protein ACU0BS_01970 [Hasllibacter sp.]
MHLRAHGLTLALAAAAPAGAEPRAPADYLAAMAGRTYAWHDEGGALSGHQRFTPDGRGAAYEFADGTCLRMAFPPPVPGDAHFCYEVLSGPGEGQCWAPHRDADGLFAIEVRGPRPGTRLRATPADGRAVCAGPLTS